eukprot:scaffold219_cov156-Amphora_coffeaeformis.AAC.1
MLLFRVLGWFAFLGLCWSFHPPQQVRQASLHYRAQSTSRFLLYAASTGKNDRTTPDTNTKILQGLRVAVVGGGPSGLLLAHRLLKGGASQVSLFESRPRPGGKLERRAYALGLGIRGRTAIKSVDEKLWEKVKQAGFLSERFHFHIGPLKITLRSERDGDGMQNYEPSLLSYQSELCRVLAEQLEERWSSTELRMKFDCKVEKVDLEARTLAIKDNEKPEHFDLIVGCDGVKSIVRKSIQSSWTDFEASVEVLPGEFKVVRLPKMPPLLDPTAVALILPKAGTCTAFVEPTSGGEGCVLFAGNNATDTLFTSTNVTELKLTIEERYPKLVGGDIDEMVAQLMSASNTSKASLVKCNTYHFANVAALVGDAAHATGGVSGQGVNSALIDAAVLADCLVEHYDASSRSSSMRNALLEYSKKQLPEGKALYELSFGPNPSSTGKRIASIFAKALDFIFRGKCGIGKSPLQTRLTTSLESFADIRRELDPRYEENFPSKTEWEEIVVALDAKVPASMVVK